MSLGKDVPEGSSPVGARALAKLGYLPRMRFVLSEAVRRGELEVDVVTEVCRAKEPGRRGVLLSAS